MRDCKHKKGSVKINKTEEILLTTHVYVGYCVDCNSIVYGKITPEKNIKWTTTPLS
jgi:hypothetical protein